MFMCVFSLKNFFWIVRRCCCCQMVVDHHNKTFDSLFVLTPLSERKCLQPCQGQNTICLWSHNSDKVLTESWSIRSPKCSDWQTACWELWGLVHCDLFVVADADLPGWSHSCVCFTLELSVRYESRQVLDKTRPSLVPLLKPKSTYKHLCKALFKIRRQNPKLPPSAHFFFFLSDQG